MIIIAIYIFDIYFYNCCYILLNSEF